MYKTTVYVQSLTPHPSDCVAGGFQCQVTLLSNYVNCSITLHQFFRYKGVAVAKMETRLFIVVLLSRNLQKSTKMCNGLTPLPSSAYTLIHTPYSFGVKKNGYSKWYNFTGYASFNSWSSLRQEEINASLGFWNTFICFETMQAWAESHLHQWDFFSNTWRGKSDAPILFLAIISLFEWLTSLWPRLTFWMMVRYTADMTRHDPLSGTGGKVDWSR